MPEERKIRFLFLNVDPVLMQKVFPQMNRLTTVELFLRLQAHCHASLIAGRSISVNGLPPASVPSTGCKEAIEKTCEGGGQ